MRRAIGITLGLLVFFASVAMAQQTTPPSGTQPSWGKMGPHRMGGGVIDMRLLRQLNLTEQQHQQIRTIMQNYAASTKPQRDELRQLFEQRRTNGSLTADQQARVEQLRAALDASAQQMRADILNVLTPEQRTQFEQLEQQAKAKREEWRKKRSNAPSN